MQVLLERYLHQDHLVSNGILPNVNSIKQNRDVRQGITVCSRIIRFTNNQTKSRKRATILKKRGEKRRQECGGYCENCISDGWCLARLGVIGFSKRQTTPGKPDAKSLGTKSTSTIHPVYATSSKYPGKQRTIAWKNTSPKSSSAKSLGYEI